MTNDGVLRGYPDVTAPRFGSFTDAYLAVLGQVSGAHQFDIDTRGHAAQELLHVSFTLADPAARLVLLAARRPNVVFSYAESLWQLAGRDDLDMIAYYAPRMRQFSADGQHLTGTAYGPRIFGPGPDRESQFSRVLKLLRADPDTKRAVLIIGQPGEMANPANPDVACATDLQFLLRGGALHMAAHMRANDALIGLLCDVFCFTFIQEVAARQLGVPVGTYSHHVGSMHINLPDLGKVRVILDQARATPPPRFPSRPMPRWRPSEFDAVLRWEQALRLNQRTARPGDPDFDCLDPYWQQVVILLEIYRQIVHDPGAAVGPAALGQLDPAHRWLVGCKWPDRMPGAEAGHQ